MTIADPPFETSLTAQERGPEVNPRFLSPSMSDADPRHLPKPKANRNRNFLRRLRRSQAGNVMMLTTAAIVPLIAMIGGAVEISRVYLTKTRLQQACDAGALAARQSMIGTKFTSDNSATANQFFRANFPTGKYGTSGVSAEYSATPEGAVTGRVNVSVPMTLMAFFNVPEWTLSASCTADVNLPNVDVMLVLDTTLSMRDVNTGDTLSRIKVLKESVVGFYTSLQNLQTSGNLVRFGFVPFSQTVNVGRLLRPDWIAATAVEYDSRLHNGSESNGLRQVDDPPIALDGSKTSIESDTNLSAERCNVQYLNEKSDVNKEIIESTNWEPRTAVPRHRYEKIRYDGVEYFVRMVGGICKKTTTIYANYIVQINMHIVTADGGGTQIQHWIYNIRRFDLTNLNIMAR